MKTVLRIVIALAVLAVVGWLIGRLVSRELETSAEPDEIEAPTEELVEAPA